ncbi:MBL fold metallo-hydrolase [Leucothrix pacifica]|uniref:MBL fold metallo-hydrolase n=1 Tax=Leucothrix pacifica TaxID=1247513 RepID=A0A317CAL7_9GAMM|nr:MBL fold metallo-hydrolase [Leucothrix pacifica]PWQ95417.1 MBL fold metallo-hydrolase [Leucothrix pacifica]
MFRIMAFVLCSLLASVSMAYELKIHKVDDNVYALVGDLSQRSTDNLGNNSTHGVIVTDEGVILIDSGASYLGAKQIHEAIQTFTQQSIKIVINSGGQDHRWLGNDYFQQLGATIISSLEAKADHQNRADEQLAFLESLLGDSLKGTKPFFATQTFDTELKLSLGGVDLELYHFGPAHTAGDSIIWMPSTRIMFTGDVVYNNRMLGIGPARNFQSWIDVFEKMASFKPDYIIPGHGNPSVLETATINTYQYLLFLRAKVAEILDNDGGMVDATKIDQSEYEYLENFETIAGRNAQAVFEQMEFDY